MLVLSRKPNERICIGDDIEILIVDIKNGRVRLGITAPRDVPVHRTEVVDRIKNPAPPSAGDEEKKDEALISEIIAPEKPHHHFRSRNGDCPGHSINSDFLASSNICSTTGSPPAAIRPHRAASHSGAPLSARQ